MHIDILTLFPRMVEGQLESSIMRRAVETGCVSFRILNIRDFATGKHRSVDERPFGGGPGMVMTCGPLVGAIEHARSHSPRARSIYLTPEGCPFDQKTARRLSGEAHLIFISGHYEGIDERVRQGWVDEELSIGDYVLTNGTLAAMVVTDAVVRLLPGVLGNEASAASESFEQGILEGPHYTRPEEFRGMGIPDILKSGDHGAIRKWRREQGLKRTRERRNDLLGPEDMNE